MRFQLHPDQVLVAVNNNNINQLQQQQHHLRSSDLTTLDRLDNELAQTFRFSGSRIHDNDLLNTLTVNNNNNLNEDSVNLGRNAGNNPKPIITTDQKTTSSNQITNGIGHRNRKGEENGNDLFDDYNRTNLIYNEATTANHPNWTSNGNSRNSLAARTSATDNNFLRAASNAATDNEEEEQELLLYQNMNNRKVCRIDSNNRQATTTATTSPPGIGYDDCSPEDVYMEEEEIGGGSPASLSPSSPPSADSPEPEQSPGRTNATSCNGRVFTRGIINPNYPGFQHFANALTEHFQDINNVFGCTSPVMAIDPLPPALSADPSSLAVDADEEEELQLSSSVSSSASQSPVVDDAVDRFNLNVITRDSVHEMMIQRDPDGDYDQEQVRDREEEEEDSVIEDNYNNLLVRCDEKVFCEDKNIHAEGFPGNSLESLDGNNENGEEEEEEEEESSENILASINGTTSPSISTTNNYNEQEQQEEDQDELPATRLSAHELNRDEIDASTGGNYLSRNSTGTVFSDNLSDKDTAVTPHRRSNSSSSQHNVIKDADGNSVTAVKGFRESGVSPPELIQMTPDILIKNISVTAEIGGIVSLSGSSSAAPSACRLSVSTIGSSSHHHHEEQQQFQQESMDGKRINCIVKCDSFAPDLLRNIQTAECHRTWRRRLGEEEEETDNILCSSEGSCSAQELCLKNKSKQQDQVLGEENSISDATKAPPTDILLPKEEQDDDDDKKGYTNLLPHPLGHRQKQEQQQQSDGDTLGVETNNLNNNGIFRHSYTWEEHQEPEKHKDALLSESQRRRKMPLDEQEDVSKDKQNNLDFLGVGEDEEGYEKDDGEQQQDRHVSSDDVMVAAMFNGTLWNSSPIDIVGDFEGEIERELGLITGSGNGNHLQQQQISRRRSMLSNYTAAGRPHPPPIAMTVSVADAALSDGREHLYRMTQQQPTVAADQSFGSSGSAWTSYCSELGHSYSSSATSFDIVGGCTQLQSSAISIPTAIVKPKYQKIQHDDRQLLTNAGGYLDYNNKSAKCLTGYNNLSAVGAAAVNPANNLNQSKRVHNNKLQAAFEEATRKKKSISLKRDAGHRIQSASANAIVGVVTPRKKNYNEHRSGPGNNNRMNCEWDDGEMCLGGAAPGKALAMDFNENSAAKLSDRNMGRTSSSASSNSLLLQKRNSRRQAKENGAASRHSFDVYNIETTLPVIDLEAFENHLAAKMADDQSRRNDREEIRRRLAMGNEDDYLSRNYQISAAGDRPTKKPSLQSRLQNGMNLQICFMNETASDTESPSSDSETCPKLSKSLSTSSSLNHSSVSSGSQQTAVAVSPAALSNRSSRVSLDGGSAGGWSPSPTHSNVRPNSLKLGSKLILDNEPAGGGVQAAAAATAEDKLDESQEDFYTRQSRLQMQARVALAQAKDLARMEMEMERQRQRQSPITELIRNSVEKVGVVLAPEKRRVSRQILTDMNIAQLQVIVNDLHSHIEVLNEGLVKYLLERDELHMSQDSMLVDIEDMTKYLEAKDQTLLSTTTTTATCDIKEMDQQRQLKMKNKKQFGSTNGSRRTMDNRKTVSAADDDDDEEEDEDEEGNDADRRSIKFQLFSNPQSSRNLMNNKINNNNSVYNATTTTGTVLNGPSKLLFRIPNLVRK